MHLMGGGGEGGNSFGFDGDLGTEGGCQPWGSGGNSSVAWTGHKNDTRHEMHQIRSLVCEILKPNCVLSSLRIALSQTAHTSGAEGLAGSVEAAPMLTQDGFVTGDITKVSSASDRMPT